MRHTCSRSNGSRARSAGSSTASFTRRTPADLPAGAPWAFDKPFFMLLNVAVGGVWPGSPDATTVCPQRMLVDYVRVYR